LVAADWQFRVLVFAQLTEEGHEVTALPSPELAVAHLVRSDRPPDLTILDAKGIDLRAETVSELWRLAGQGHLILCSDLLDQAALGQADLPPIHLLRRPFRVGDLVERVRRLVP